jgi:hypothetical protein
VPWKKKKKRKKCWEAYSEATLLWVRIFYDLCPEQVPRVSVSPRMFENCGCITWPLVSLLTPDPLTNSGFLTVLDPDLFANLRTNVDSSESGYRVWGPWLRIPILRSTLKRESKHLEPCLAQISHSLKVSYHCTWHLSAFLWCISGISFYGWENWGPETLADFVSGGWIWNPNTMILEPVNLNSELPDKEPINFIYPNPELFWP